MSSAILPDPGFRDKLGSDAARWAEGHFVVLMKNGLAVATIPLNAGLISGGVLDPDVITSLLGSTVVSGVSLATILANAALGAGDPAARINAGVTLLQGAKIADHTLSPNAINVAIQMAVQIILAAGDASGFITPDFAALAAGWRLSNDNPQFNRGIWNSEIRKGPITVGFFRVNADGSGTLSNGQATGLHWDAAGNIWVGTANYADAMFQIDLAGNIFVTDNNTRLSKIDPGVIGTRIYPPAATPNGGDVADGTLVTLVAPVRGSDVYFSLDGSNPPNDAAHLYTAPFAVHPPVTLKMQAYKIGHFSEIITVDFTTGGGGGAACSAPNITPATGYYTNLSGTKTIHISSSTAGATLRYTTDGTDPTFGIIFTGDFVLGEGDWTISAIAKKAGLADSTITENHVIIVQGGSGGGGGHLEP